MSLYKDEVYVAWDTRAGNIINHLYDIFVIDGKLQKIDVHIFLHQSKLRDQRLVDWPENFIFHFTSTASSNALQTSLIAYVLEKFERLSRELELEEVSAKSNVFFIQESASQFEELKSMLYRVPYIKNSFNFKLLSLSDEVKTEMLFQVCSNKRRSADDFDDVDIQDPADTYAASPRSVRHGRRASDFPVPPNTSSKSVTPLSFKSQSLSPSQGSITDRSVVGSCKHCDRRRGSQPKFNMMDKKFFCMACFLEGKNDENTDLCRICKRSKDFTVEEKATMTSRKMLIGFERSISIQCDLPVHEFKDAFTQTKQRLRNISTQTDISIPVDLPDYLQKKLDDLMIEIEEYRNRGDNEDIPDLNLQQNDDAFRLAEAQVNPITNKFDCPFCEGKSFAKISIFEVHLRNVHKKCNCSCERYFESREDYLDHFYSVFPLPCFEQRKCPERFRSVPYQAIHHAKVHFAEKPYCCVLCFSASLDLATSNNNNGTTAAATTTNKKINYRFKSVRALQLHAKEMGHDEDELFLRVKQTEESSHIPLTGRASAINYSGDY